MQHCEIWHFSTNWLIFLEKNSLDFHKHFVRVISSEQEASNYYYFESYPDFDSDSRSGPRVCDSECQPQTRKYYTYLICIATITMQYKIYNNAN